MHIKNTRFPGLFLLEPEIFRDERGLFCVPYSAYDLRKTPNTFAVMQQNIAVSRRGAIRGVHAEPWDKWITIALGSVFVAIVDLINRPTYGQVYTRILKQGEGLLIRRGLGNSYQALADDTVYIYGVNGRWRPGISYPSVAYNDPDLAVNWPIQGDDIVVSEKDQANPGLKDHDPKLYERWIKANRPR